MINGTKTLAATIAAGFTAVTLLVAGSAEPAAAAQTSRKSGTSKSRSAAKTRMTQQRRSSGAATRTTTTRRTTGASTGAPASRASSAMGGAATGGTSDAVSRSARYNTGSARPADGGTNRMTTKSGAQEGVGVPSVRTDTGARPTTAR